MRITVCTRLKLDCSHISKTMSEINIPNIAASPLFVRRCFERVTGGLVNCPVVVVSRNKLAGLSLSAQGPASNLNKFEREAAAYYERLGYSVTRLDHFASCSVHYNEGFDDSAALGKALRALLPSADYLRYIHRDPEVREGIVLNGVDPRKYALAFYPPDFLVAKRGSTDWKFVEVKGPADSLHFHQANWYVNLMPPTWHYEIFASLGRDFGETYRCMPEGARGTSLFSAALQEQLTEVQGYLNLLSSRISSAP